MKFYKNKQMKSHHILKTTVLALILLQLVSSGRLKSAAEGKSSLVDLNVIYKRLFKNPLKRCNDYDNSPAKGLTVKVKVGTQSGQFGIPNKKENQYEAQKLGWGPSAYLFDFLDKLLQDPITKAFNGAWSAAIGMKEASLKEYSEQYTLNNILSGDTSLDLTKMTEEEKLAAAKSTISEFDPDEYKNSLSAGKIFNILKDWKWNTNPASTNPTKTLIDQFDFNGDGRLNKREFILAAIINNRNVLNVVDCQFCFHKIAYKTIDPIFMYLDTCNSGTVNSEQIWKGLKKLRIANDNAFNLYNCKLNEGKFRTTSVNDFVLKAKKSMEGELNMAEFRVGILQAYWDRHTEGNTIYSGKEKNAHNLKSLRWTPEGNTDIICETIKEQRAAQNS